MCFKHCAQALWRTFKRWPALLLAQGVHPRLVMEILGHSQIAVTMNTYSHVIPAMQQGIANRMDEILNPVAPSDKIER